MFITAAGRLTCAAFLASISACASAGTPAGAPATTATPARWTEPPAYTYVLTTGCTRGFSDARFRVVVENGEVVSSTAMNEQARSNSGFAVPTLGRLDTWIATEETGNPRIRRDRDPVDGRPVAFGFDPEAMAVDAGRCFAASDYDVRAVPQ